MTYRYLGVDDTDARKGKKEKKGFKQDRYERYQAHRRHNLGLKPKASSTQGPARATKEVTFDEESRKEFLLTMHKKKNERRVQAFVDAKRKMAKENAKVRAEQREKARQAYNSFARVPINPDFSFQFDSAAGLESSERSLFRGADDSAVSVTVSSLKPLSTAVLGDLPAAVVQEIKKIQQHGKGPPRTRPKDNQLKELQKIRKIKKHSRKGHGKKGAKGKKGKR
jgi:uncharacterized protein with PIN domain